jgi:hypothetical protein
MGEGKFSVFYVVATIFVMLSLSLAANGVVSADAFNHASHSASSFLAGVLLPDEHHFSGTLYDMFCYAHNEYFGLRF